MLDTHIALWLDSGDDRLRPSTRALIDGCWRDGGAILLSAVSAWEIALLVDAERIVLDVPVEAWIERFLGRPGVEVVALSHLAACRSYRLHRLEHRDPADRLLIAGAKPTSGPMNSKNEAALADYVKFTFTDGPWTRSVYRRGSGPTAIVIHEMPGLHPLVIRFADRIVAAGMTVFLPALIGEPGRPASSGYALRSTLTAICIRREFNFWSAGKSSQIVAWLRALARKAHSGCGGRGVGAIGMCFTGGFALAMMTEPSVVAPALSQPSLPAPAMSKKLAAGIDAAPEEIACARRRFEDENLSMIGLRFKSDRLVPDARFDTYRREFGDRFEAIELEDADAAPPEERPIPHFPPHSVLTMHMREDGPTKAAEQRVIAFFKERTRAMRSAPSEAAKR